MLKMVFSLFLILADLLNANSQKKNIISTGVFTSDLKNLIAINTGKNSIERVFDLSGKEYVNIITNATAGQIIEITKPYFSTENIKARDICLSLLDQALEKKAESETQKQGLIEILCRNYLNRKEFERVSTGLLLLKEKDFDANAKKYIATLVDSLPGFNHGLCAKLLGLAQIKKSIPLLWKTVDTHIETMRQGDLDILASLARMDERQAGVLLCNYYNSKKNIADNKRVLLARNLAFSLDKTVLNCLISDLKTIDTSIHFRDNDVFICPSCYLGGYISVMLRNYPYPRDYRVNIKELLGWLNESTQYDLGEK